MTLRLFLSFLALFLAIPTLLSAQSEVHMSFVGGISMGSTVQAFQQAVVATGAKADGVNEVADFNFYGVKCNFIINTDNGSASPTAAVCDVFVMFDEALLADDIVVPDILEHLAAEFHCPPHKAADMKEFSSINADGSMDVEVVYICPGGKIEVNASADPASEHGFSSLFIRFHDSANIEAFREDMRRRNVF